MTVSVIIPAFNASSTLLTTIDSALRQTRAPDEIVIVDDGSTDGTAELAAQIQAAIPIVAIRQANQGPAAARNRGIAAAKGDVLAFLDADDLWTDNKLERQLAVLESEPDVALVFSNIVNQFPDGSCADRPLVNFTTSPVAECRWHSAEHGARSNEARVTGEAHGARRTEDSRKRAQRAQEGEAEGVEGNSLKKTQETQKGTHAKNQAPGTIVIFDEPILSALLLENMIHTPTVVVRRTALSAGGPPWFDENLRFAEDIKLWMEISRTQRLAYIAEVLCYRRLHEGNVTKQDRLHIDMIQAGMLEAWLARDDVPWLYDHRARAEQRVASMQASIARRLVKRGRAREARGYLRRSLAYAGGLKTRFWLALTWLPWAPTTRD